MSCWYNSSFLSHLPLNPRKCSQSAPFSNKERNLEAREEIRAFHLTSENSGNLNRARLALQQMNEGGSF